MHRRILCDKLPRKLLTSTSLNVVCKIPISLWSKEKKMTILYTCIFQPID